ncbi:low specificity L-threonine aldolase [Streptomyces alfalfae]|uniref:threonine aldolase family protein n=1 Tax=Streptomyces alfalfae TaxID=1642299 RepID=UPI001BA57D69|nr:low specificity L-threonine aldolase [Streptomyces alfalfae]QUI36153.1 low specificity L-threonine aldolase [Streptomyces alfalfae]
MPSTDATLRHDPGRREFTSDNCSGAHAEILSSLILANGGHQQAYGEDQYTARLDDAFRRHFGPAARAFPVFNGTGANVIALQAVTNRWGAILCAEQSHLTEDEGGAPEHIAGLKLLELPSEDGKISPHLIDRAVEAASDVHSAQPQAVSLAQATELGTCYTPEEIGALSACAHAHGLTVHMDGARLANAAAFLGVSLSACTTETGIDILSFGGTKNGLLFGECIVVLDPSRVMGIPYLRKRSTHLASKMRFLSVQFEALLEGDLWRRNASHANAMAARLGSLLSSLNGVRVTRPVEANSVFVTLPGAALARLLDRYTVYTNDEDRGEVRLMCSFDTTERDVDTFGAAVEEILSK